MLFFPYFAGALRAAFDQKVDQILKAVCLEISKRYEMKFIEIGTDRDHVHFVIQSIPIYSPTKIIRTVKSLTAREIFKQTPEVKWKLSGGRFWMDTVSRQTVSRYGSEETVRKYVQEQGIQAENQQPHWQQLKMFE